MDKKVLDAAFEELMSLSDKDFKKRLEEAKNNDFAQMLLESGFLDYKYNTNKVTEEEWKGEDNMKNIVSESESTFITESEFRFIEEKRRAEACTSQDMIKIERDLEELRKLIKKDIYADNGYMDREHYLHCLSEDMDIPFYKVKEASELLGPNEDFDGLVSMLEDHRDFL